jgi:hypothetical protein
MKIEIKVFFGVAGPCLIINGKRVSGPEAWGGARALHCFSVEYVDLLAALPKHSARKVVGK